jgi:tetratricopeptide (TPR) repeat protein
MSGIARVARLVELGRYAAAKAELAGHLADVPDSVVGWCLLAVCELNLNQLQKAQLAAERALRVEPDSDFALRLRAGILSRQNYPGAAVEAATAAVRADPNSWLNHHTLAFVLLQGKEKVDAYRSAEHAVELAPDEPDAHVMLGVTAAALGRKREARAAYREALRHDPAHPDALNNLAAADLNRLRLGRGARRLVDGLRSNPGHEVLQGNLDVLALRLLLWMRNIAWLAAALLILSAVQLLPGWCRALAAALLVAGDAVAIWWTFRELPAGARRHLRGLLRRRSSDERVFVFTVAGLHLVVFIGAFGWDGVIPFGIPLWMVVLGVAVIIRLAAASFAGPARRR